MNIQAKLLEVTDTQQISDKFRKREFVVEFADNPQYPEFVKFELIQDKCDLIDAFQPGQQIDVHFNLKGRKWTDPKGEVKYFNTLQAWKLDAVGGSAGNNAAPASGHTGNQSEPEWLQAEGDNDDLPF